MSARCSWRLFYAAKVLNSAIVWCGGVHALRHAEATVGGGFAEGLWAWQDSNLRPTGYEPAALTAELQAPA